MTRYALSVVSILAALSLHGSLASAAQQSPVPRLVLDCATPQTVVERTACADPALRDLWSEVDRLSAQLKTELPPTEIEILTDTEKPFVGARNACQNQPLGAPGGGVAACLRDVLTTRHDTLNSARQRPGAIRVAITQFPFIDGPFFKRYGESLANARVEVFGCLALTPGRSAAERTRAVIHESSVMTSSTSPVPVQFKSMNDRDAAFLDDKQPCAFWRGIVQSGTSERFLYVDEILGTPLR